MYLEDSNETVSYTHLIFNYYWKKPWDYLDEVIDATQTVYEQNNHTCLLYTSNPYSGT